MDKNNKGSLRNEIFKAKRAPDTERTEKRKAENKTRKRWSKKEN